jgi:two-component system nitrate/nitrite response regulator NarL
MISTMVVSDVRLYREGLAQNLSTVEDISIEGTTPYGGPALRALAAGSPRVTILDLTRREDLAVVRTVAAVAPSTRIVVLAVPELDTDIVKWVEAGIAGYVTRDAGLDELVTAIRCAARDELVCSPRAAGALRRRVAALATEHAAALAVDLTPRQYEVLSLIACGQSNKEIASALRIELPTVKYHVHNSLDRLGVARRGEAVARITGARRPFLDRGGDLHGD